MRDLNRILILLGVLLILLFHAKSFFVPHLEGDEIVYLELSRSMHWDFSNYTTRESPIVKDFARAIYRAPLFLHPPLFPFILKCFAAISQAHVIELAMVFGILIHLGMFFLLLPGCKWLGMADSGRLLVGIFVVFCPVLGFSTTRIQIDGLLALLGTGAVLLFIRACQTRSLRLFLIAGILGGLAINTKITAFVYIPVFLLLSIFSNFQKSADLKKIRVIDFIAFWGAIAIIGIPHYAAIFQTYHTFFPMQLMKIERPLNLFQQMVLKRTPGTMVIYQCLIYPLIAIFLMPAFWKKCVEWMKILSWFFALALGFLILYSVFTFISFDQERYWAPFLPLLFILFGAFFTQCNQAQKSRLVLLASASVLCMYSAGFIVNCLSPQMSLVIPAVFYWVPSLNVFYH